MAVWLSSKHATATVQLFAAAGFLSVIPFGPVLNTLLLLILQRQRSVQYSDKDLYHTECESVFPALKKKKKNDIPVFPVSKLVSLESKSTGIFLQERMISNNSNN